MAVETLNVFLFRSLFVLYAVPRSFSVFDCQSFHMEIYGCFKKISSSGSNETHSRNFLEILKSSSKQWIKTALSLSDKIIFPRIKSSTENLNFYH